MPKKFAAIEKGVPLQCGKCGYELMYTDQLTRVHCTNKNCEQHGMLAKVPLNKTVNLEVV